MNKADKLLEDLREVDLFNVDSVNYGNRKHYIDQLEALVRQQQAEIEALKAILEQEGIGVGRDLLNGGIALFRKAKNEL